MPKPADNSRLFSAMLVAECCGISDTTLRRVWDRHIPESARHDGRYTPAAVVAVWRERIRQDAEKSAAATPGGDDWADRVNRAKALRAEHELAVLQGKLLDATSVRESMDLVAAELSSGIERVREQHGDAPAETLVEVLRNIERILTRRGKLNDANDGDGGSGEGGEALAGDAVPPDGASGPSGDEDAASPVDG